MQHIYTYISVERLTLQPHDERRRLESEREEKRRRVQDLQKQSPAGGCKISPRVLIEP